MNLFGTEESFVVPAGTGGTEDIRRALRSLFEFHKADFTETQPGEVQFSIPALVLSSRNKPLHRFQRGTIGVRDADDGKAEVYFSVLLSKPNIVSCVGSVALGLVIAAGMLATGETPLWWSLGAAAAGLMFKSGVLSAEED